MGRTVRRGAVVVLSGLVFAALAGCAARSTPGAVPGDSMPIPISTLPTLPALPPPPPPTSPPPPLVDESTPTPGFAADVAVDCLGQPTGTQVTALLRARSVLTAGASARVTTGPLCAGDWQYTVVTVTGREPLQVVSQGEPTALTLVTAGTDVCSTAVRGQAPPGILALTHCSG
jgi:hypothetical protein